MPPAPGLIFKDAKPNLPSLSGDITGVGSAHSFFALHSDPRDTEPVATNQYNLFSGVSAPQMGSLGVYHFAGAFLFIGGKNDEPNRGSP